MSLQREVERLQDELESAKKARREEVKDWVGIIGGTISAVFTIATFMLAFTKHKKEAALTTTSAGSALSISKSASNKNRSSKAGSRRRKQ
jgi:hypothetical protein